MIRKTAFLDVLEDIHRRTDERYGQILSNALATRFKTKGCDCGNDSFTDGKKMCKCKNSNGRGFNTFAIWDEDFTDILDDFHARLFPDEKKPVRKKPKVPPGTINKAEWKRLDKISREMAAELKKRSRTPG